MPGLNISKVKFLVVEDNPFMKDLMRQILRTLGVQQIVEAADGAEGYELFREMIPDIVLLDWHMEPMNGLELTKMIRGPESPNRHLPVIMITAYSEIDRVTLARDAGVNEILVKPIAATNLFARIRAVIERPRLFVEAETYFGPDRRRRADPNYKGEDRRTAQKRDLAFVGSAA